MRNTSELIFFVANSDLIDKQTRLNVINKLISVETTVAVGRATNPNFDDWNELIIFCDIIGEMVDLMTVETK